VFQELPCRSDLLHGLLGADIISFNHFDYVRHYFSFPPFDFLFSAIVMASFFLIVSMFWTFGAITRSHTHRVRCYVFFLF